LIDIAVVVIAALTAMHAANNCRLKTSSSLPGIAMK
jgi:hypothetical protein